MKKALMLASLALLTAGCGGEPDTAAANRDLATLLPDNCGALVRLRSLDEVTEHVRDIADAFDSDEEVDAREWLGLLGNMIGDTRLIDGDLPIALAVALKRATPPSLILIVPTTDVDAYRATLPASPVAAATSGNYVGVPIGGHYARPAAPQGALLASLPDAALAAHGDIEKLMEVFGAVVGLSLSTFEAQMAEAMAAQGGADFDAEGAAEAYTNLARTIASSSRTLRVGVDFVGGELSIAADLAAVPGSDLAGWSSPPAALGNCARGFAADASVEALMVADWQKLWPRYQSLLETLTELYPPEFADALQQVTKAYEEVLGEIGPTIALSGSMFDGIDMLSNLSIADPERFTTAVQRIMTNEKFQELGITFAAQPPTASDGVRVIDSRIGIDWQKLMAMSGEQANAAAQQAADEVVRSMLGGEALHMTVAASDGRASWAIGQQTTARARDALAAEGGSWSAPMQAAIDRLQRCNPLLIERFDMGPVMTSAAVTVSTQTGREVDLPKDASANVLIYGGVEGDTWRVGLTFDLVGYGR
ncbi:MAG: hypothetical protein KAI24_01620, partial [Planctomycetes bacterium]|nr:hypothetical protein [Planctomycetota bacterium]